MFFQKTLDFYIVSSYINYCIPNELISNFGSPSTSNVADDESSKLPLSYDTKPGSDVET